MSLDNVNHILLIFSGKGGVGKSSVTTQLALSLSLAGKSVGILDIDLTGPSIPRLLGLEDAKITQAPGGWNPVRVHPAQAIPHHEPSYLHSQTQEGNNGKHDSTPESTPSSPPHHHPITRDQPTSTAIGPLYAASLAFLLPSRSSAVIWRGPKKTAMVRQFLTDVLWPPLDYLLIDTPPGTSDEHIALAETLLKNTTQTYDPPPLTTPVPLSEVPAAPLPHLAGALVVTTPQAVSISDVRKELNFCRKTGIGVVGVVENMSGFVCECCGERTNLFGSGGGEAMAKEFEVRFLGGVPVDMGWGKVVEEGGWAEYGKVEAGENGEREDAEEDGNGDDEGMEAIATGSARDSANGNGDIPANAAPQKGTDKALLVDRYRSCKLCEVFGGISRRIIDIVETPG